MAMRYRWCALVFCAAALSVCGVEKKMIGHSWDLLGVSPADVARNLDAWEQVPLDGISLALRKKLPDGTSISFGTIMTDPPWQREWLARTRRRVLDDAPALSDPRLSN